jgi:hypothetical protein
MTKANGDKVIVDLINARHVKLWMEKQLEKAEANYAIEHEYAMKMLLTGLENWRKLPPGR